MWWYIYCYIYLSDVLCYLSNKSNLDEAFIKENGSFCTVFFLVWLVRFSHKTFASHKDRNTIIKGFIKAIGFAGDSWSLVDVTGFLGLYLRKYMPLSLGSSDAIGLVNLMEATKAMVTVLITYVRQLYQSPPLVVASKIRFVELICPFFHRS